MHPIENIMKTTMEELNTMIDVNTIIGEAVNTADGAVILPVSKVSFGFVSGGGEYGDCVIDKDPKNQFAGGSGAGVTISPVAFLVVNGECIRLMPVDSSSPLERLIEMFPQALDFAKDIVKNKNTTKE